MTLRRRQLYSLTEEEFRAPNYVDEDGRLQTQPAGHIPLVTWPDGSWCHPANTFMRELYDRRLSRRNRGGSLAIAASKISHLLRFCWRRRVDVHRLTDNDFRQFVAELLPQKAHRTHEKPPRDSTTVLSIGRTCLQFLHSVGRQMGDDAFIGPEGRIRAERRSFQLRLVGRSSKEGRTVTYWFHPALPEPDAVKKRVPISTASIELLRKAVSTTSTSSHQRMRRHVALKLLEVTGARRGEVAWIRVSWIRSAAEMDIPMLRVPTFKKRAGHHSRLLPIARADLQFILQYVDFHRRAVLRRHMRGAVDHDFLLVSGTTGKPLAPDSITKDLRSLAKAAGIQEKACPHMFRHRFLTKLFVALIEQHEIANPDEFRRLLIQGEELKQKVAEWSGHSNLASLDVYIDLAFDEVSSFKKTYDLVGVGLAIDGFLGTLQAEAGALEAGEPPAAVVARMLKQVGALQRDLVGLRMARETG